MADERSRPAWVSVIQTRYVQLDWFKHQLCGQRGPGAAARSRPV